MNGQRLLLVVLVLQLAILALQARQALSPTDEANGGPAKSDTETLENLVFELREEFATSRYEIQNQTDRLRRLLDQLADGSGGAGGVARGSLYREPDADLGELTEDELVQRLYQVDQLHDEYRQDPIQRVPVEKERARIEEELRRRGDAAIDAIELRFKDTANTRHQTRMITHVVTPIGTERAYEFARKVFEDISISAGVRLVGARLAREKYGEEIDRELVDLLIDPDVAFGRREQIIYFFKENPYPPAGEAIAKLAVDPEIDRTLRRYSLQALASYEAPAAIDALKKVATDEIHGDLRAEALRSLSVILGPDVLDFARFLRGRLAEDDLLHNLIDDLEAQYRNQDG